MHLNEVLKQHFVSMVTDLPLQVGGFVRRGSWQDAGVAEARPEQHPHHEDEEDGADRWDGRGQVGRQEGTAEDTETKTTTSSEKSQNKDKSLALN